MEAFLHYLWLHQRYEQLILTGALAGARIEVLDPGELNLHAGPDFFAARIRIDQLLWVGCVEIHHAASEWFAHGHHADPAYSSVILHVVEVDNRQVAGLNGQELPTCLILVPRTQPEEQAALVEQLYSSSSAAALLSLRAEERSSLLLCLYRARMQSKVRACELLLERAAGDWAQCFWAQLLRYFGGALNSEAMERLAFALPLHLLQKHSDRLDQVEALLLGQAGLIEVLPEGTYRTQLAEEYHFLRHKYELRALGAGTFRRARTRPANLPERRLLQLASLLTRRDFLGDRCLRARTRRALHELFSLPAARAEVERQPARAAITSSLCDLLIINVVIPYQVLYAQRQEGLRDAAPDLELLRSIPAEDNRVTRLYRSAGLELQDALESQAILQLEHYREEQERGLKG
nr:DUF2851 family protein [uncultured Porphyromonas sp.]